MTARRSAPIAFRTTRVSPQGSPQRGWVRTKRTPTSSSHGLKIEHARPSSSRLCPSIATAHAGGRCRVPVMGMLLRRRLPEGCAQLLEVDVHQLARRRADRLPGRRLRGGSFADDGDPLRVLRRSGDAGRGNRDRGAPPRGELQRAASRRMGRSARATRRTIRLDVGQTVMLLRAGSEARWMNRAGRRRRT